MSKFISSVLNEASRMLVNHQSWAYLDKMPIAEQLDVIQNYNNDPRQQESKYIVVVFEKDERRIKHEQRCEELGLNKDEEVTFGAEIIQDYKEE
tara:strand:- start:1328 stop:1609 length:282 start_codon:yes stop_codon:yes gene_type:complete